MLDTTTELSALAKQIHEHHRAAKNAIKHAIEAGRLLLQAKAKIGTHGECWLRDNCEMSTRTAQDYMQAAKAVNSIKSADSAFLENLTLHGLLKLLREPKDESERQGESPKLLARIPHKKRKANPPRVKPETIRENDKRLRVSQARLEEISAEAVREIQHLARDPCLAKAIRRRKEVAKAELNQIHAAAARQIDDSLAGPDILVQAAESTLTLASDPDSTLTSDPTLAPNPILTPSLTPDPTSNKPIPERLRTWLEQQPDEGQEIINALFANAARIWVDAAIDGHIPAHQFKNSTRRLVDQFFADIIDRWERQGGGGLH